MLESVLTPNAVLSWASVIDSLFAQELDSQVCCVSLVSRNDGEAHFVLQMSDLNAASDADGGALWVGSPVKQEM